jgi:hypothetical protein
VRQHHIALLGDQFDHSCPAVLVEDGVQRLIELVGLKPVRLGVPDDASGQIVRAFDEEGPAADRLLRERPRDQGKDA